MYLKINRQVTLSNLSVCLSILEERCFIGSRGNNQMKRREGLEREKEKLNHFYEFVLNLVFSRVFSGARRSEAAICGWGGRI
jgi:hypothetical protein